MSKSFYSVKEPQRTEIVIKKSRFIADIFPVFSLREVEDNLHKVKKEFPDARHHCYAYLLEEGERKLQKFSDDGEPAGTAGKPILNALNLHNLENILLVVTRYFGGIKLGASGLARAYAGAAEAVIKKSKLVLWKYKTSYSATIPYQYYATIEQYLLKNHALIRGKEFQEEVSLKFVPYENEKQLISDLENMTQGKISLQKESLQWWCWNNIP